MKKVKIAEVRSLSKNKLFVRFADRVQGIYDVTHLLDKAWERSEVGGAYAALVKAERAYEQKRTGRRFMILLGSCETLHAALVRQDNPKQRVQLGKLGKELAAVGASVQEVWSAVPRGKRTRRRK